MEQTSNLTDTETAALRAYRDHPMQSGDVALFVDPVIMEVAGLADHWDSVLRTNIAATLAALPVDRVVVAIARSDSRLHPGDHVLWAELREELLGKVTVEPVVVLPAA